MRKVILESKEGISLYSWVGKLFAVLGIRLLRVIVHVIPDLFIQDSGDRCLRQSGCKSSLED